MYQTTVSFQAPLTPQDYCTEAALARENQDVFETTWQMVGLASSINTPGQYLAAEVGRIPVVVRNFDGEFSALLNVCAHRHCTLVSAATGHSEKLKCPYHGWEYGADGRTRKIPAAKNFPDFDRERYRLNKFSLERCGDLLFVRIASYGPSLKDWMGELFERFEEWTSSPSWKPVIHRTVPASSNWKVPVEVSLESYHIPEIHPQSFGEDPGESESQHSFSPYTTSFYTSFIGPRLIDRFMHHYERFLLRIMGAPFRGKYQHHHVFPNLLVSHTDSLTLFQVVRPSGASTSSSDVWQYGRQSSRRNPLSRLTAEIWARVTAWLSYQVLKEDLQIFRHVQRGERAATDTSIFGRCEERLHAFQMFLKDQIHRASIIRTAGHSVCTDSACRLDVDKQIWEEK
ncbi:MAG: SRPBCC family protein [Planctomycetaceae bacterium]